MEKILIACMAILLVFNFAFESRESFKRQVLYFLLVANDNYAYQRIFVKRKESINQYINRKPGLEAQLFSSYYNSKVRKLLQEIEGFNNDKHRLTKEQKYKEVADAKNDRNAKIAELYTAIGSPQI